MKVCDIKKKYYAFLQSLGRQCDICFGKRKGVRGNGNLIRKVIVCDNCTCDPEVHQKVDAIRRKRDHQKT
jgi:hypothetical protein